MNHRSTLSLLLLLGFLAGFSPSAVLGASPRSACIAKEFLTVEEALALAFPKCKIERGSVYLTKEQKAEAAKLAKFELDANIVHPYEAFNAKGKLVGTAYFDTHQVRTKKETIMIVVAPDTTIARIEVCAFAEPIEYMPGGRWYGQFLNKPLDDELNLKRRIRGVTGATLTAQATTQCARRVLALHTAIQAPVPTPEQTASN